MAGSAEAKCRRAWAPGMEGRPGNGRPLGRNCPPKAARNAQPVRGPVDFKKLVGGSVVRAAV